MLFLLPFFANMVFAMMWFTLPVWSVSQGAGVVFTGSLGVTAAVSYLLANITLNRLMTEDNAARIMAWAIFGATGITGLAFLARDYLWMLPLIAAYGFAAGSFFGPFQVVMRQRGPRVDVGVAVVRYNLSWTSGGMLAMPLAGWLLERGALASQPDDSGREGVHAAGLAFCILCLTLIARLHQRRPRVLEDLPVIPKSDPRAVPQPDDPPSPAKAGERPLGRLAEWYSWVGWAGVFVQAYANATINYIFPKLAADRGFSEAQQGIAFGLIMAFQAACGAAVWLLRRRLYRPDLTVLASVFGIAAFLGVALSAQYSLILVAMACQGAAAGTNFFLAVFYANNSPRQGKAVTINEAMVGLGLTLGPALGAVLARQLMIIPYFVVAILFALVAIITVIGHRRLRPHA